jgi:CheY-like chemotaxis protein
MRLDFNVLWVDDQPERIASQIKAITKHMEEQGFEFKADVCKSIADVRVRIKKDVFSDEVDLILVDWDLGEALKGQDAIAEIRETAQYKEVVFYSAHSAPEQLRELAFNAKLEGIYCAARDGLVDEVIGVFDSLVKKVLDLDHTRGIVMGATSDIDNMVNECLTAMHGKLDDAGKRAMLEEAVERADERVRDLTKTVTKLRAATTIEEFFKAHMIFTANDRLRVLGRALDIEIFKAHNSARAVVTEYRVKIVPRRNDLGHLVLVPEGKPQAVIDNEGKKINLEEMRELRRLILNLRSEFRKLLTALQASH